MSLVGKWVLEHWVNGGYEARYLREIHKEDKRFYYSHVQRTAHAYRESPVKYVHVHKWAKKFKKDPTNPLGFSRSIGERSNTDGQMHYLLLNSPSEAISPYRYEDVFETDLRQIQSTEDYPLKKMLQKYQLLDAKYNTKDTDIFKIIPEDTDKPNGDLWGLGETLKKLFEVPKVYCLWNTYIDENDDNLTILSKSGTLFHLLYNTNVKYVDSKTSHENKTICFWLFKGKLVYHCVDGYDTW